MNTVKGKATIIVIESAYMSDGTSAYTIPGHASALGLTKDADLLEMCRQQENEGVDPSDESYMDREYFLTEYHLVYSIETVVEVEID